MCQEQFDEIINYKVFERSLNVLHDNYYELIQVVEECIEKNPSNLIPYGRAIDKTIHNFAAAIGTCIERARKYTKTFSNIQFEKYCLQKIKEHFYTEECRFADNLRNFLLHYSLPKIIWRFKNSKIDRILFQKKEFNEFKSWDIEAIPYIDKSESIDVIYAIKEYYKSFCQYYDWYYKAVLNEIESKYKSKLDP